MKIKRLWFLLPVSTMFLCFYLYLEAIPFGEYHWWEFPAEVTLLLLFTSSVIVAIDKTIGK